MKKLEEFKPEKIEINSIYGGKESKLKYIITGNNEDLIEINY